MKKEIIATDNYLLILSDDEIKHGDGSYILSSNLSDGSPDGRIFNNHIKSSMYGSDYSNFKKIAWHLPLKGARLLDGVPMLPNIINDELIHIAEVYSKYSEEDYIRGFNKHAEVYKFTEKDIREAMRMVFDWSENDNHEECTSLNELQDKFLSLQKNQYPSHFKFDVESSSKKEEMLISSGFMKQTIKTTTNHLGQTVAVGKYIFE